MSIKISTLINMIDSFASKENATIIMAFYNYMQERGSSENHMVNNLRVVMDYTRYLGNISLHDVNKRGQILSFLNTKSKDISIDPDKKWVTTWNHYLNRIKLFYRWLFNVYDFSSGCHDGNDDDGYYNERLPEDWKTPDFVKIKQIQVYPNGKVIVILECTYRPFKLYEEDGCREFFSIIGKIDYILSQQFGQTSIIPPTGQWLLKEYDRDVTIPESELSRKYPYIKQWYSKEGIQVGTLGRVFQIYGKIMPICGR